MAEEEVRAAPSYPPAAVLDALFLRDTCSELEEVLQRARHEVSYFGGEIGSLAGEPNLPAAFQAAYGRIISLLAAVETAIAVGNEECRALYEEFHASGLLDWKEGESAAPPIAVEAARSVIREINDAEIHVTDILKSARSALAERAKKGLFDWSMPFNCKFTVLFDTGPTRRFYQSCGEGEEPIRLRVRPAIHDRSFSAPDSDGGYNWNMFQFSQDHPLQDDHHGYLVHCLLDHSHLPWEMLPHIREIEVELTFTDFETAWGAPSQGFPTGSEGREGNHDHRRD